MFVTTPTVCCSHLPVSHAHLFFRMSELDRLATSGRRRLHHALRPGTWANHRSHFRSFLKFCYTHRQNPARCSIDTILGYTQFLIESGLRASNINNYLGSLKTVFKWLKINVPLTTTDEWQWNLRSVPRVIRDPPIFCASISLEHLRLLCMLCFAPLRVFLTFAYFGLFRISNLLPASKATFDRTGTHSSMTSK